MEPVENKKAKQMRMETKKMGGTQTLGQSTLFWSKLPKW